MAGGRRIPGLLVLGGLALSACGSEPAPPLVASNIEISAPMPGRSMSAAYLDLTNNSGETITIDEETVHTSLKEVLQDQDLSRFIL